MVIWRDSGLTKFWSGKILMRLRMHLGGRGCEQASGSYSLSVMYRGEHIKGSPYRVAVRAVAR